jgi:hypothetical protein
MLCSIRERQVVFRTLRVCFTLAFVVCASAQDTGTAAVDPIFVRYSVKVGFRGTPALPKQNTLLSRTFRTVIRREVAAGANFADHYTLASWGCGGGCVAFSIIDDLDGTVYDFPYTVSSFGIQDSGVDWRRDSNAVHVVGSLNEGNNLADRWYVWDGKSLKKVFEKRAVHEDP